MQTTVEVNRNDDSYVEAVYLLHETDQVIVAQIQTKPKYPDVTAFNHVTVDFKKVDSVEPAQVRFRNLPFDKGTMTFNVGRHTLYVVIFNFELEEQLAPPIGHSVSHLTLYESEEWKNK
jgi:hypothetical protein